MRFLERSLIVHGNKVSLSNHKYNLFLFIPCLSFFVQDNMHLHCSQYTVNRETANKLTLHLI